MKKYLLALSVCALFYTCTSKNNQKFLPSSVGAINSLYLIINDDLWNGTVGDEVRKYFAAPVDGLPWEEPIFSIHQMPAEIFTGSARNSRNILIIEKGASSFAVKDNSFAKPQKVAYLGGENEETIIALLHEHAPDLIKLYKKHDIEENQRRLQEKSHKEAIIEETLGISLSIPSLYKIVKQETNFFWIERQIPKGTMNIILYEIPLNTLPEGEARVEAIIKMRDSIGERYIPGREEGMHMITEKAYAPYVSDITLTGRKAIETRGMWEMKNFFMAGPFINYMIEDFPRNRFVVIEGFTFAPSANKRDYMFELEAILQSIRLEKKKPA